MLKHDILLSERYRHLGMEARAGRVVLKGLPERTEEERRLIRHVFSSFHCRLCGDCCRGFSFSNQEPNYREIATRIDMEKRKFMMEVRLQAGNLTVFRADPSFSSRCGFLEQDWDKSEVPREVMDAGQDFAEDWAPFGCEIYKTQPRVCSMYPVQAGIIENPGTGEFLAKNAMNITAGCKAIMELLVHGIGHVLGSEIMEFWRGRAGAWVNFGETLSASVSFAKGLIKAKEIDGFHFSTESGESVFPLKRAGFPPNSSG